MKVLGQYCIYHLTEQQYSNYKHLFFFAGNHNSAPESYYGISLGLPEKALLPNIHYNKKITKTLYKHKNRLTSYYRKRLFCILPISVIKQLPRNKFYSNSFLINESEVLVIKSLSLKTNDDNIECIEYLKLFNPRYLKIFTIED